jgi:sugar-specific transcriptional regulator TrmB
MERNKTMATERLAGKLKSFGLEKEEAEIYVFLSASGPTPARVVARRFNLNRMKAYRSLKVLEEKEFVQRVMGRPVKFIAAPLRSVIDRQLGGLRQTLTDLEVNQDAFIREWENLARGSEQRPEEPRFRIFQGRQQVLELLLEMYDRTHETVRLVTTTSDLARLSLWGLDDKLKALNRQGKKIRILTQIDIENWKEVEPYSSFTETRHITLQNPIRFAIIDKGEALTTVAMDDSMSMTTNSDTGLWTDAPSYVAALGIFFDAIWNLAPDAELVIESIKTGEPTPEIRTYATREEYATIFSEMIAKASQSIDIIARNATTLPVPLSMLEDMARNGIKMRLLTRTDNDTLPEVSRVADTPIVVSENAAVTDLVFVAIDGKEVLLNVPYAVSQNRTIWSNMSAYVGTMMLVFKDYWELGKPLQERLRLAAQRRRAELLSKRIKVGFEEAGWEAETPGIVIGKSSKNYDFDILAVDPTIEDSRLCIDVVLNESIYNKIIERSNVVPDIASARYLIASLMPIKTEELRLAELYRIRIIHSDTEEALVSAVINLAQK